jgi:FixJ family two-component response regulator
MAVSQGAIGAPNAPILVVEDERDLRVAVCELLTDEGFAVENKPDPDEALAFLDREHVSVVLADYLFGSPERSARVARALLDRARGTPVGLLTGWTAIPPELAPRYAFKLVKPVDPQQLLAMVGRYAALQGRDEPREAVIQRYFDALTRRSWKELGALCTDRVTYHLAGTDAICGVVTGRGEFEAYTEATFAMFQEARFEVTQISWLPRGAVASYRGRWTASGDGSARPQASSGAVYFQFEANRIASLGVRMDMKQLRALLGAESGRPAASVG